MAYDIIGLARANRIAALSHLASKRSGFSGRSDARVHSSVPHPHLELVFISTRSRGAGACQLS